MGVYIKGMEMPTNCWNCPVDKPLCTLWQGMTTDEMDNGRHKDCPLVPVPPHGRCIDADALSAKLNMLFAMAFGEGDTAYHSAYRSLGRVVENAPTIIEAEEE